MRLGVTGATSSIGRAVCDYASALGHEVVRFVRRPTGDDRYLDLAGSAPSHELDGIDALIHMAWQWSPPGPEYRKVNVEGSRRLFDRTCELEIPVVLLSTFSVFSKTKSDYADCKRALEYDLHGGAGSVVRAGLIWGGEASGMAQTVIRLSSTGAVCFHLSPEPLLYQTERQALAQLLVAKAVQTVAVREGDIATVSQSEKGPDLAAWPVPFALSALSHSVRAEKPKLHVPLPVRAIRAIARAGERAGLDLPVRSDSFGGVLRPGDVCEDRYNRFVPGFPDNEAFVSWLVGQSSR